MISTILLEQEVVDSLDFGATVKDDSTYFKIYSSAVESITLHIFHSYQAQPILKVDLQAYKNNIWAIKVHEDLTHFLYGYKLHYKPDLKAQNIITTDLIADPYSKHVTSINHYLQYPLTYIVSKSNFKWEDQDFEIPKDHRSLIIYETHIKDMTACETSRSKHAGSYLGFLDKNAKGGINHIKKLGVNAVEFLPLQKFAHFEPSYYEITQDGAFNTWNYYGRNHWGYMTSFYFAPETFYASDASKNTDDLIGENLNAEYELKSVINSLHKENICVIMDVVYNHASNYDLNPLKYLDLNEYFRTTENGYLKSDSGCGNDLNTESTFAREIIIESLKHWMIEYHVDGFRFDLASLIDWETIEQIKTELRKINPNVILIAEPWSPVNYEPTEFGNRNWLAWNDKYRNGIKGIEPNNNPGFIFGENNSYTTKESIENYLTGSLIYRANGIFPSSSNTVNYLESHDGYTLNDFIRLKLNPDISSRKVTDYLEFCRLNSKELSVSKFAALILSLSQGAMMIHAGQEIARSKIIADTLLNDPNEGFIDHDSYNKDNETNYINFDLAQINANLLNWYIDLIEFRKMNPDFYKSSPQQIEFFNSGQNQVIAFNIKGTKKKYQVWLNGSHSKELQIDFDREYRLLIDKNHVYKHENPIIKGQYHLLPCSGIVLEWKFAE